ncbi:MAG TPA: O-antigen ligase family protein [Candidatus Wunengus sp. YC61]|uniref:O-antigen ligase family protein n=1 Tax=Candidatus Wunengus sp. YC61 TaxID=3367698 RepID=UPI004027073B
MILTDRLGAIFDKVIFYGLIFLVVFTPFATVSTVPFSFDMPWSLAVTALIVLFLVALWLIRDVCQGTLKFASTPLNLPFIAFVTLVLFQLLPLPPKILQFISPSSVSAYKMTGNENLEDISKILWTDNTHANKQNVQSFHFLPTVIPLQMGNEKNEEQEKSIDATESPLNTLYQRWHPITLYKYASEVELFRLLIYIGVYLLIVNNIKSRQQISQIVITIIITGISIAFLGLLQYLSGSGKIFWLYDIKRTNFFGTFSNQDHFACYMAMIIPLVIGLLITEYLYRLMGNLQSTVHTHQSDVSSHRIFFYVFGIVIMLSSLFMARSSGGAFSIMVSVFLLIVMMLCRKRLRKMSWIVVPILIVTLGMLIWIGIRPVIEELSASVDIENPSLKARVEFWKDTISAVKVFPLFGTGIGVFPTIYPQYSTITHLTFMNHAHNDYLELMLETGFIGFGIILWAMYRFIKDNALYHILGITNGINHKRPIYNMRLCFNLFGIKNVTNNKQSNYQKSTFEINGSLRRRKDPFIIGIAIGGVIGVMSMCFHCIVDFNFHVPANAFLLCVILGITTVTVHMKHV